MSASDAVLGVDSLLPDVVTVGVAPVNANVAVEGDAVLLLVTATLGVAPVSTKDAVDGLAVVPLPPDASLMPITMLVLPLMPEPV